MSTEIEQLQQAVTEVSAEIKELKAAQEVESALYVERLLESTNRIAAALENIAELILSQQVAP